jgi:Tfp pilus tip-associated adhesin PilY1
MDAGAQLWVYWGTGNKLDPKSTDGVDRFFAVKEKDFTSTRTKDDLEKLTEFHAYQGTKSGWYVEFPASGEKMLFDSTVFGGMAIFTTYVPSTGGADPCAQGGDAYLYAMAMMPIRIDDVTYNTGAGLMNKPSDINSKDGGKWSKRIGTGIPTAPLISQKPTQGNTDLYLTVSGGSGTDTVVNSLSDVSVPPPPTNEKDPCDAATPPAFCRFKNTPAQAQIIHWRDRRVQ